MIVLLLFDASYALYLALLITRIRCRGTACRTDVRRCVSIHTSIPIRPKAEGCVTASQRSFPDTNLPLQFISRAQFSKRMSVVRPVFASVWQENRGQRTRVLASLVNGGTQSWMKELENKKEEEKEEVGAEEKAEERNRRRRRRGGRRRRWGVSTFTRVVT